MKGNIVAVKATHEFFVPLKILASSYYPEDHPIFSGEFLKWLYLDNPAGEATLIIAQENDTWIGMIGLIPIKLKGEIRCSQMSCFAVHVLSHPEHRNKNIFLQMITKASSLLESENIWLIGHPNANALPFWKRKRMEFRESLKLYLAKPKNPFNSVKVRPIKSIDDLIALPTEFWYPRNDDATISADYTPEFIYWRYILAPHKNYKVNAVYRGGDFLGLSVKRLYKWPFDLLVDAIGSREMIGGIISSELKPTLILQAPSGHFGENVTHSCWKIPVDREFPFFVTTWGQRKTCDMTGVTLSASDF